MSMEPTPLLSIVENQIVISGGLSADARPVVTTRFVVAGTDKLIPYYDGLAMLEVAKQDFIRRYEALLQDYTE